MKPKSILLLAASLGTALLLLELGSWGLLQWKGWSEGSRGEFYERGASGRHGALAGGNPSEAVRTAHPYFGFVFRKGNNYGFMDPRNFPYRRQEGEFVIGIFGGSTAMHWAQFLQRGKQWQGRRLKHGQRVVVVNFSISGMRQPQLLNVASRWLDTIDAAVVLDGWNDAVMDFCPEIPGDYPDAYGLLFPSRTEPWLKARFLAQAHRSFSGWAKESVFGDSSTVYLVWKLLGSAAATDLHRAMTSENIARGQEQNFPECAEPREERIFFNWLKYSRQMKALAEAQRVPLLHFVQPTPFVIGAKPLTPEESEAVQFQTHREGAPHGSGWAMSSFLQKYRKQTLAHSTDLTFLFREEKRPVYIDPFTHLNELGYSRLSEKVAERLVRAGLFD